MHLATAHDREFHVASLPNRLDSKVMHEGWEGPIKDSYEVPYEISKFGFVKNLPFVIANLVYSCFD